MTPDVAENHQAILAKGRIASSFSGLDPELRHNTGGVGGLCRHPHRLFDVQPITDDFSKLVEGGRVTLLGLDIGLTTPVLCFVFYDWTGGRHDGVAAKRTNHLMAAISQKAEAHPQYLCCAVGDLNADPQDLPDLNDFLESNVWIDVGAKAEMVGGEHKDPCPCIFFASSISFSRMFIRSSASFSRMFIRLSCLVHAEFAVACSAVMACSFLITVALRLTTSWVTSVSDACIATIT